MKSLNVGGDKSFLILTNRNNCSKSTLPTTSTHSSNPHCDIDKTDTTLQKIKFYLFTYKNPFFFNFYLQRTCITHLGDILKPIILGSP